MSDPSARYWTLMTKTEGGVVSILRELTLDECRQAYHRLNPDYQRTYTNYATEGGGSMSCDGRTIQDSDIAQREVFGPPGWDASEVDDWDEPWPKIRTIPLDSPEHVMNDRTPWPAPTTVRG